MIYGKSLVPYTCQMLLSRKCTTRKWKMSRLRNGSILSITIGSVIVKTSPQGCQGWLTRSLYIADINYTSGRQLNRSLSEYLIACEYTAKYYYWHYRKMKNLHSLRIWHGNLQMPLQSNVRLLTGHFLGYHYTYSNSHSGINTVKHCLWVCQVNCVSFLFFGGWISPATF